MTATANQSAAPALSAAMERIGAELEGRLKQLLEAFHLSAFERNILLLCAAMELDPEIPDLCGAVHEDARLRFPTFRLALAALPEPHWTALLPSAPLRRWKLIEVGSGERLATSPLRIEESVLHVLMGVRAVDERLSPLIDPVEPPAMLPQSYRKHAEKLMRVWAKDAGSRPVVQLDGNASKGKRSLAAVACAALGLRLHALHASKLPSSAVEREGIRRLWERESVLNQSALLIEAESSNPAEMESAALFVEHVDGLVALAGAAPFHLTRPAVRITIDRPGMEERRALWTFALGDYAASLNGEVDRVAMQFPLEAHSIVSASRQAVEDAEAGTGELFPVLWQVCRSESRSALEGLAQRVETRARWQDLILPESSMEMLRAMAAHVRQQAKVLEGWGFSARSARGLGITALFSGPSGTGKTLGAEILANELELDLYRIDLSQVVSKYIGETEKNLRGVFDAAETSGAALLFDEADALFGKRSEVKDSHDRYANIEVSYLLQRMEAYRGLAILTTNLRGALDAAFLRRIRYIVNFPFPDAALRRCIWERIFPDQVPRSGLDIDKLARLHLPGGNIRNVALNAAFLAAEDGGSVEMRHLLRAARTECAKLDRPLSDSEIGGWV